MSGDVQPRKRKDKRRKKEGGSLGSVQEPVTFKIRKESDDKKVFDVPDVGEKIHVQSDHGVGGNFCVKIIFFCLFGLLIGAVGLIYMKSQGSSDVDLPTIEESRFAEYFTGWLDDSTDEHEHEHEPAENGMDHEHDELDEHDEHNDRDDHDEEEDQSSEQDPIYKLFGLEDTEVDEVEESDFKKNKAIESELSGIKEDVDENEEEEDVDEDEDEEKNEDEDEDEDKNEDEEEEKDSKEEEVKKNEEDDDADDNGTSTEGENDENEEYDVGYKYDEDDLSQMSEDENRYDGSHKSDENELSEEINDEGYDNDNGDDDDDNDDDDVDDDDDDDDDDDNTFKNNEAEKDKTENMVDEDNTEAEDVIYKVQDDDDELGFEEIDISEEDLRVISEKKSDLSKESLKELFIEKENKEFKMKQKESGIKEEKEKSEEIDSGGVAVKLGVGIALIIVAHLVLVKKWESMTHVPSNEDASVEVQMTAEKKEIENLQSVESIISRKQTLVPENICFINEPDEEEDRDVEEDETYSEEECEENELEKIKSDNWETFEKPFWDFKSNKCKEKDEEPIDEEIEDEEPIDEEIEDEEPIDEEIEDEEEYEENDEAEEEEDVEEEIEEEDCEEDSDDDIEDNNALLNQKTPTTEVERRQEEIQNSTPIPPPRNRAGRGAQEVDGEDFIDQFEEVEETGQNSASASDEINNNSEPDEQKTSNKKTGSEDEWAFRQELDFADRQFENNPKAAVEIYEKIISQKPSAIRALIGRARALDHWAEKEKSNKYLKKAINAYKTLLLDHGHLLDDETFVKLAERCIERIRFSGAFVSAIDIHKALILKYPDTPKHRNALAVTYLMLNRIPQARVILNETLSLWPKDGFALVHYGFILKTSDNNMEEGAKKLMAGIQTGEKGVIEGMFFFHLGDALNRLGRGKEAMEWFERGVKEGLFLSKYQRSLYNVNRLKGQPWWTKEETTYQDFFKKLEDNWREIRKEGLELLNAKGVNLFKEEAENLKNTGDWKQLDLYFRGRKQPNCNKAPVTCSLVSSFKPAATCSRGQIKFSVMLPNTHVWPHCGPTNCRLRSHLGLIVPKRTFIRVAEETRSWEEGKVIIFDDSFEHEVWHNGTSLRLVLIVDVWHPELTNHERLTLSPI